MTWRAISQAAAAAAEEEEGDVEGNVEEEEQEVEASVSGPASNGSVIRGTQHSPYIGTEASASPTPGTSITRGTS
jgi:hypothetical protein